MANVVILCSKLNFYPLWFLQKKSEDFYFQMTNFDYRKYVFTLKIWWQRMWWIQVSTLGKLAQDRAAKWRYGASVTTDRSRFTGQPLLVPGVEEGLFSLPAAVSR